MKTIALYTLLIFCLSCQKQTESEGKHTIYHIHDMKIEKMTTSIYKKYFTPPVFIKLGSQNNNTDFGKISKIKIANDRIYILDQGIKSLIAYQSDGKAIQKIGKKGQGPNEYLDIADFDVDKNGYIYAIDGRLDKLFIYDEAFHVISSEALPFEADKIQLLDNGKIMFALSSWNKGKGHDYRIIITDSHMNILQKQLPYDEFIDDNYWISDYQLIKTTNQIIYNRTIDNDIHIFSTSGELLQSITLDFGQENVPNKIKKQIEQNIKEFDKYTLLKGFSVCYDNIILGTIWRHRNSRTYLLDTRNKTLYLSDKLDDSDNTNYTGFCDSTLISFMDPDYYQSHLEYNYLTQDLINYLDSGNFILSIKQIRSK